LNNRFHDHFLLKVVFSWLSNNALSTPASEAMQSPAYRYAGRFGSPADGLMHQKINQYIDIGTITPDDDFQLKGVGISKVMPGGALSHACSSVVNGIAGSNADCVAKDGSVLTKKKG
jgi:hypothetical protein